MKQGSGSDTGLEEPAVFVVDDDQNIREGLNSLFTSAGYRTCQFGSAEDFMSSAPSRQAGCLILDIHLPGVSGLDFQERLHVEGVTMPVIMITGNGDVPMTVRAMKAGAVDFLQKPYRVQEMLAAVAKALTRDSALRRVQREREDLCSRVESLSPREREVMELVAKGKMNKQIAYELAISEATVKIHRGRVMRKMRVQTVIDLAFACKNMPGITIKTQR